MEMCMNPVSTFSEEFETGRYQKQLDIASKLEQLNQAEKNSLKNKLRLIAELFEIDVLSADEASRACEKAIQQHAKVTVNTSA